MRRIASPLFLLLLLLLPTGALAQGFAAQVLPPRFEERVQPGGVFRNVIEVQNASAVPARFTVRTADWVLDEQGEAIFEYALQPGSCRPWVGLEAGEIQLDGNGRKRFRFEVAVPANAPSQQCRFAIMIEGQPQPNASGIMVSGRIGIIVYLNVGDAAAHLAIAGTAVDTVEGAQVPILSVSNDGNAHGRLEGYVQATDAEGKRTTLMPSMLPIMPGTTRAIPLFPVPEPDGKLPALAYPVRLKGELQWDKQRIPVEATADQ